MKNLDGWLTLTRANSLEGNKPLCQYCYVPCDPQSRAYRAMRACEYCYDEYKFTTLTIVKKEKP